MSGTRTDGAQVNEIRALTARRVEIFRTAGSDWRFAASLKSISEDTAQEYEGRAVLELIQNAHDAIGAGSTGRVHVLLDVSGDASVLYVANDGLPFRSRNFRAIVGFGLSDKGAGEGIGNKGLGFRSVLALTDHPEVYSLDPNDVSDRMFEGYSFRFPHEDELRELTEDADLAERLVSEVSPLDFPLPAKTDDEEIVRFGEAGFVTVVRLPLRDETAVEDVRRQIGELASADAPVLLFLDRVAALHVSVRVSDEGSPPVELSRIEGPTTLVGDHSSEVVREVHLGPQGRYLMVRRSLSPADLREVLEKSAVGRDSIDKRWLQWKGDAWVGVALRLDEPIDTGRTYTYLPMDEPSPLAAHVHAPFFTKLARREVSLEVPLNHFLMGEVAGACLDLIEALREGGDHGTVAPLVVDLVAWNPPRHEFLVEACAERGGVLTSEALVPTAGTASWATLDKAYASATTHRVPLDPVRGNGRGGWLSPIGSEDRVGATGSVGEFAQGPLGHSDGGGL